jgi:hypothetical protein
VARLFDGPKLWNIIDCDARAQAKTNFTIPDAVKAVSLNEIHKDILSPETYEAGDAVAHYLLVSQNQAITLWQTDFSATSVFYAVLKGCKVFYLIRPTANNMRLWEAYMAQSRRDVFFGNHPSLNGGGCQKVFVTERNAICMPAGMIHCVETVGTSVAFG